jgi:hypothetical protein
MAVVAAVPRNNWGIGEGFIKGGNTPFPAGIAPTGEGYLRAQDVGLWPNQPAGRWGPVSARDAFSFFSAQGPGGQGPLAGGGNPGGFHGIVVKTHQLTGLREYHIRIKPSMPVKDNPPAPITQNPVMNIIPSAPPYRYNTWTADDGVQGAWPRVPGFPGHHPGRYSFCIQTGNNWTQNNHTIWPFTYGVDYDPEGLAGHSNPGFPPFHGTWNNDSKLMASMITAFIRFRQPEAPALPPPGTATILRLSKPPNFLNANPLINGDGILHTLFNNRNNRASPAGGVYPGLQDLVGNPDEFVQNWRVTVIMYPNFEYQENNLGNSGVPIQTSSGSILLTHTDGLRALWHKIYIMCERMYNHYSLRQPGGAGVDWYFIQKFVVQIIPAGGGCNASFIPAKGRVLEIGEITVRTFQSRNNNCLLRCLRAVRSESIKKTCNQVIVDKPKQNNHDILEKAQSEYDHVRGLCGLARDSVIPPDDSENLRQISQIMRVEFTVELTNGEVVFTSGPVCGAFCHTVLLFSKSHYYVKDVERIPWSRCGICGKYYKSKHTCNEKRAQYVRNHHSNLVDESIHKETDPAEERRTYGVKYDPNNTVYYDMETFPDGDDLEHVPYAVGCLYKNCYRSWYGFGCINVFLHYLETLKPEEYVTCKGVSRYVTIPVMAWNASRYDAKLILRHVTVLEDWKNKFQIKGLLSSNNKILHFSLQKTGEDRPMLKFMDPYLFIPVSLRVACEQFKIDGTDKKTVFPHKLIRNQYDVNQLITLEELNDPEGYLGNDKLEIKKKPYTVEEVEKFTVSNEESSDLILINLKDLSEDYLRRDVESMKQVVTKFFGEIATMFDTDLTCFSTISQFSCCQWYRDNKFKY